MGLVFQLLLVDLTKVTNMRDTFRMDYTTEKDYTNGLMATLTKDSLCKVLNMDLVFGNSQIKFMLANLTKTKDMATDLTFKHITHSKIFILDSLFKMYQMGLVYMKLKLVKFLRHIVANGNKVCLKVMAYIYIQTVTCIWVDTVKIQSMVLAF